MANTGVLPFVRGLDLSLVNVGDDRFPSTSLSSMSGLRWLRLTDSGLDQLPADSLAKLGKLEHLTAKKNHVDSIGDIDFEKLPCLRSLNLSHNKLTSPTLPLGLFESAAAGELTTLDLSHNELDEVPEGMAKWVNIW